MGKRGEVGGGVGAGTKLLSAATVINLFTSKAGCFVLAAI